MKVRPVEAELFHTDRQADEQTGTRTDMTELRVALEILRTLLKMQPNTW
jgi:hypothetical protein